MSRKHLTHTDALGHFTMTAVRPGKYRIVTAPRGVKAVKGRAQVELHPGEFQQVNMQF